MNLVLKEQSWFIKITIIDVMFFTNRISIPEKKVKNHRAYA